MKTKLPFLMMLLTCGIIHAQVQQSFYYDGIQRFYNYHLPPGYNEEAAYPLVLNLHGYGSTGFQQQIYSGMNLVADEEGFVAVYPEGVDNTWNVSYDVGTDDVGFISALIDTVAARFSIDTTRVYATGMSMGGFMSYRLACQLGDKIAAIASVTGLLAYYPCIPSRPVPIMQIHGTADPLVPYSSVPATINHWVGQNGCDVEPVITELPDTDPDDGCTATLSVYSPCEGGVEIRLFTINGGEHTWPGATLIIGVTNQDINASEEIWKFFERFTLAGPSSAGGGYSHQGPPVSLNPNPAGDGAYIEITSGKNEHYRLSFFDMNGRKVLPDMMTRQQKQYIDCRPLAPGLYIVLVDGDEGATRVKLVLR